MKLLLAVCTLISVGVCSYVEELEKLEDFAKDANVGWVSKPLDTSKLSKESFDELARSIATVQPEII